MDANPDIGNRHRVDFRVIRDATMCYLYSSGDNGRLSRAGTTIGAFPKGFRSTQ
ncbi:non-reducing end alpha-L-arabinofuranosidase family hydrolase [Streptomyces xiamenensis]